MAEAGLGLRGDHQCRHLIELQGEFPWWCFVQWLPRSVRKASQAADGGRDWFPHAVGQHESAIRAVRGFCLYGAIAYSVKQGITHSEADCQVSVRDDKKPCSWGRAVLDLGYCRTEARENEVRSSDLSVRLLLILKIFQDSSGSWLPISSNGCELVALPRTNVLFLLRADCCDTRNPLLKGCPWVASFGMRPRRAARVARIAEQLKQEGWRPELILAHTGWG